MRILHFFLFAILLKNVYCHSSNPVPKPNASPFQVPATNTKLAKVRPPPRRAPPPPPPRAPPPPPPQVTSYILAVTWPPGACTGNSGINCKITPIPTEFKIHGLWPQPNGPPSKETFGNQIASITTDLNNSWPNLWSKTQLIGEISKFWEREWTEHGKYSALGVLEYFKKALQLFDGAGKGLKGSLAARNITPINTYKLEAIERALKEINCGFSCTVICNKRKTDKGETQIQEIRFRYTKGFVMQDNRVPSTTCGTANTTVMFPTLI